jgi:hypothetical protein
VLSEGAALVATDAAADGLVVPPPQAARTRAMTTTRTADTGDDFHMCVRSSLWALAM